MKKLAIIVVVSALVIFGVDTILSQYLSNIDAVAFENITDTVVSLTTKYMPEVSSTPNGAVSFENITSIQTSSIRVPIIIEEADVEQITVLDSSVLSGDFETITTCTHAYIHKSAHACRQCAR
ncbi:MAG: hypothetical protein ATN35_09630 [Epulopiscium sp. Nele67-Bin004]|nr:MAG: hypothetical protein ATN35_09630 [Epulopiscium sp. Nele67-Bin004]